MKGQSCGYQNKVTALQVMAGWEWMLLEYQTEGPALILVDWQKTADGILHFYSSTKQPFGKSF